jgi:hypothetical protein
VNVCEVLSNAAIKALTKSSFDIANHVAGQLVNDPANHTVNDSVNHVVFQLVFDILFHIASARFKDWLDQLASYCRSMEIGRWNEFC